MKARRYNYPILCGLKNESILRPRFKPILSNLFVNVTERSMLFSIFSSRCKTHTSRFKHNCLVTGRSRGTITKFLMSRMVFKAYAMSGVLTGVKKARW